MFHRLSRYRSRLFSSACTYFKYHRPPQAHYLLKSNESKDPIKRLSIAKPAQGTPVQVWEGMTVRELAASAKRDPLQIVKSVNYCLTKNKNAKLDSKIEDRDFIISFTKLLGLRPVFKAQVKNTDLDRDAYPRPPPDPEVCTPRPAIVTILGHVDHGKTTLLDALRSSRLVDDEFGGITQHLAAFCLPIDSLIKVASSSNGEDILWSENPHPGYITFLDTPGHAAFSAIRARGANVTDIVVLVVAADDGVMPQTVECIRFAKEANTPIVVAINKIDKHGINVAHVIEGLAMHGVVVEQLGGEVQAVEISALKRINLSGLLESILLQAELMQLKGDATGPAEAYVLEVKTEHGLGKVATCLVSRGQLKRTPESGPLVANEAICSPRLLFNDLGQKVSTVDPGYVARVVGWKELPAAGSQLLEVSSMASAVEVVRHRRNRRLQEKAAVDHAAYSARMAPYQTQYAAILEERTKAPRSTWRDIRKRLPNLQSWMEGQESANLPKLTLTIKADVQGSLDAIRSLLSSCPSDQCLVDIVQAGVGPLTESEVENAAAAEGTVLLFNVSALPRATKLADLKGVTVNEYNIIYRLGEEVRDLITSRLPPDFEERIIGEAEVLKLFSVKETRAGGGRPTLLPVAGCRCTRGQLLAQPPKAATEGASLGDVVGMFYRVLRPPEHRVPAEELDGNNEESALVDTSPLSSFSTVISDRIHCHSLRHEKTTVESIKRGVECGLSLVTGEASRGTEGKANFFSDWRVGDLIQCFVVVKKSRTLDWAFEGKPVMADEQ